MRFDLLGVQAHFVIPANYVEMVTSMSGIATKLETEKPAPPRLSGTALIVEDNLIIAMAAEVILLELGARHVETAASVNQALAAIERAQAGFRAARSQPRQREQHPGRHQAHANSGCPSCSPPAMASGRRSRPNWPTAPVVQKPYTREVVEAALGRMRETMPATG